MSWPGERIPPYTSQEQRHSIPTGYQQLAPSADPSVNASLTRLDYAKQEAFYLQNEQNALWPYKIGVDPTYSHPGSSVGSIQLEEIDWQEIIDLEEGPPSSSGGRAKVSRRKEQNRAAQRAFRGRKDRALRERKDRALIELQEAAKTSKERAAELELENNRLREKLKECRVEIDTLRCVDPVSASCW